MRLDARKGDVQWSVWHVPSCRPVKGCVWIDDATATAGFYTRPFVRCGDSFEIRTEQYERIRIVTDLRLVLIDPVDDQETETVADVISAALLMAA